MWNPTKVGAKQFHRACPVKSTSMAPTMGIPIPLGSLCDGKRNHYVRIHTAGVVRSYFTGRAIFVNKNYFTG